MKNKLLLVAMAALLYQCCFAEDDFTSFSTQKAKVHCSLGIAAGLDVSWMKSGNADLAPSGAAIGANGGVAFNMRFLCRNGRSTAESGVLAFQPEIRYAGAGCKLEGTNLNLSYIMIPIMFQVYPVKSFYIELGPEPAFNIGHSPDNFACGGYQVNLDKLKANDFMIGFGLGMNLRGFIVGARYNIGLSNAASNLPWKNNIVQINIGYLFSLKSKKTNDLSTQKFDL